jgi:hypothetical protein
MIRRGFWLVAGAAIGVAGYRKATRLARTLTGQPTVPRLTQGSAAGGASWPVRLASGGRSTAAFVRDVRAGMAEYRAEHGRPGPAGGPGGRGTPGPADDRARRGGQIGRSLGTRSPENPGDRAQPGASQRGPREH